MPQPVMELHEVIEGALHGSVTPVDAPDEAGWHAAWIDHGLGGEPLETMAALGGALADRLAWVFLAGYQATIYRCFPDLPREPGWTSFVNTEDAAGALPGTSLEGEGDARRLNGWKGWVAASAHTERLLVSAKQEHTPFILLRRDTPGVVLHERGESSYLPELTQGRVEFVDVEVPDALLTGDERTFPTFRAGESAYIRVAAHAFVLSHGRRLGAPPSLLGDAVAGLLAAAGVVALPMPSDASLAAMYGADLAAQRLFTTFEEFLGERDPDLHRRWVRDRRLLTGASERLRARAEAFLGAAGGTGPGG